MYSQDMREVGDAHLVHNESDPHAAPDVTTKSRPTMQPETNVAIEIAPGTHDLAVDASFSGTVLVCVGPSHRRWTMLRGSGVDDR